MYGTLRTIYIVQQPAGLAGKITGTPEEIQEMKDLLKNNHPDIQIVDWSTYQRRMSELAGVPDLTG